jgi:hypothetical protein
MSDLNTDKTVIVTGDIAMDWNLARTRRCKRDLSVWSADDVTSTYWQRGGSALLADLIEAVTKELQQKGSNRFTVCQTAAPRKHRLCPHFNHVIASVGSTGYNVGSVIALIVYLILNHPACF